MIFRENCVCGAEFNISISEDEPWYRDWVEKQYITFLDAHQVCRENNSLNSLKGGNKDDE